MTGFNQVKLLSIHILSKFIDETQEIGDTLKNRLVLFYSHVNSRCALSVFVTLSRLEKLDTSLVYL